MLYFSNHSWNDFWWNIVNYRNGKEYLCHSREIVLQSRSIPSPFSKCISQLSRSAGNSTISTSTEFLSSFESCKSATSSIVYNTRYVSVGYFDPPFTAHSRRAISLIIQRLPIVESARGPLLWILIDGRGARDILRHVEIHPPYDSQIPRILKAPKIEELACVRGEQ